MNVEYEVTGGGITGHRDTATFELFRRACTTIYSRLPVEEGRCVIDLSQDKKKKAMVQQTYRVRRTVEDGEVGYTLNVYPTSNKMLLNGKDVDTFMDKHLPRIHEVMCQIVRDEELGNVARYNDILSSELTRVLYERQNTPTNNHLVTDEQDGACNSRVKQNSRESHIQEIESEQDTDRSQLHSSSGSLPAVSQEQPSDAEICPGCKRPVRTRGAACMQGKHWIHYRCDKLTSEEIYRLDNDPGFIYNCKVCIK